MTYTDIELISYDQRLDKDGNGKVSIRFRLWLDNRKRGFVRVAEYPVEEGIHKVDQIRNGTQILPKRIHDGIVPYIIRNFGQTQRKLGEVQNKWLIKH